MPRLPKVKIILPSGDPSEYICELEQARDYLNFNEGVFMVEGQGIQSFDELVRIGETREGTVGALTRAEGKMHIKSKCNHH